MCILGNMHGCFYGLWSKNNKYRVTIELVQKNRYIKKTFRYMKLSPDHKRSDFKIKSIRIIQPDLQAKEIQIIDVKEIYDRRRYNISREALYFKRSGIQCFFCKIIQEV